MFVEGLVTTKHDEIRRWVEERNGWPVRIQIAIDGELEEELGFAFSSQAQNQSAAPISWDEFWRRFEAARLAFVYQDKTADGALSFSYSFL